jgi:hypothetical protein
MDLLERYLQAVGQYLPAKGKKDTLAELRANLLAEMDGRAEELGRPLNESEVAAVLEKHGSPAAVAARYLPRQFLIGPSVFPLYWFTLRKSFPLVLVVYATVQATKYLFGGGNWSLGSAIGHLPFVVFTFWAWMTLGFSVFEFAQGKFFASVKCQETWSVRDLPAVAQQQKGPSFANRVADLIVNTLIFLWLLAVPTHPYLILGPRGTLRGMPFGLSPEWHIFYWQIVALFGVMLVLKFCQFMTRSVALLQGLGLATQAVSLLVLAVMVQARTYFVSVAQGDRLPSLETLASVNYWVNLGFKVALVVAVIKLAADIWQIVVSSRANQGGFVSAL